MKIKTLISIIILCVALVKNTVSQTYSLPNYALKSHETLVIKKIEVTDKAVIFFMSIENRIEGGDFCADKNIFIIYPDGTRSKLSSSNGIPVCPETYKFKTPGEKLDFTLSFPPLKPGTNWVDLIEECSENCFSFYGLTLNSDLNRKLDEAFSYAERGETAKAISLYTSILESIDNQNSGIEGVLFTDIITLVAESGDNKGAEAWYKRMLLSGAPRLELYIQNLNSRGIKY
jgi:hypothetical protein